MHKGSCLCGSIKFEINCNLEAPSACHCRECRKHSGHFEVSVDIPRKSIKIQKMLLGMNLLLKFKEAFVKYVDRHFFGTP